MEVISLSLGAVPSVLGVNLLDEDLVHKEALDILENKYFGYW